MATAADLQSTLDNLGLGFLFPVLNTLVTDPSYDVTDVDQVSRFIENDPTSQDQMKKRFSGNQARIAAGLQPYKPSEYIAAEKAYIQRLKDNGMPLGFYDTQEDLAKLIGNDVSAAEFDARLQRGYMAAQNAPQAVKRQLQDLYGVSEADMAAYYLDPTRAVDVMGRKKSSTLYARQLEAAQIAAQGKQQANIQLGAMTAEELAAGGISAAQAQQGFAEIGATQELFKATTGEMAAGEQAISTEQQVAGVFGTNAQARQAIAERKRRRQAAFEGSTGFEAGQAGAAGLRTVGQ